MQTLIEYLEGKHIITEITGEDDKWKIDVENLLGSNQSIGKGTATSSEKQDVYVLETQNLSTGKIVNERIATTKSIKIAATSTSKTYNVVYYGKNIDDRKIIGNIADGAGGSLGSIEERLKDYLNSEEGHNGEDNDSLGIKVSDLEFIWMDNGGANYTYFIYENVIYKDTYVTASNPEEYGVVISVEKINSTDLTTLGEQINTFENIYYLKENRRDVDLNRTFSGNAYKALVYTNKCNNYEKAIYYNTSGEVIPIIHVTGPQTFEGVGYIGEGMSAGDPNNPFEEGYYSDDTHCYYDTSGVLANVDTWMM